MNKIDTLRTVRDFYATPEGDPPDPEVGGQVLGLLSRLCRDSLNTMKNLSSWGP